MSFKLLCFFIDRSLNDVSWKSFNNARIAEVPAARRVALDAVDKYEVSLTRLSGHHFKLNRISNRRHVAFDNSHDGIRYSAPGPSIQWRQHIEKQMNIGWLQLAIERTPACFIKNLLLRAFD